MGDNKLKPGVYDLLVTTQVREELRTVAEARVKEKSVSSEEASQYLSELVRQAASRAFDDMSKTDALEAANEIVRLLGEKSKSEAVTSRDTADTPLSLLRSIAEDPTLGDIEHIEAPLVPLSHSRLVTNTRHQPNLVSQIKSEIRSADEVLLLCSFIRWSGLNFLRGDIHDLIQNRGKRMRVITTTYMNATEAKALRELERLGADIHVSYSGSNDRLHAKAWMFRRDSEFTSAYIGSSNISQAAITDGLEWNVRLTQQSNPRIVTQFVDAFEGYWESKSFRPYNEEEFLEAQRENEKDSQLPQVLANIEIRPYEHQREILDALSAEREHGHTKNLVVAATGTGKTVVAALDYRRLADASKGDLPSLLFVAHRKEILEQALQTFRLVLRNNTFGELLVDGHRPRGARHIFASIQSLASRLGRFEADDFDIVIVDEVHHASAPTYEALLQKLEPEILLGLTATPERADGQSILPWFDDRIAYELRLWKALDEQLLVPFHYFGIGIDVDLRNVEWIGGSYKRADLSSVLQEDPDLIKQVAREVNTIVEDVNNITCLAFCVDVAHAEFVAYHLRELGFNAESLTGRTPSKERSRLRSDLKSGTLQILTVVDVFNEGVDIPRVDTVLFLRPTESPTIYLQQLGRGLRKHRGKTHLTVLDFVGMANKQFRWDRRLQSLLGGTRQGIFNLVQDDFPELPSGCVISLDEQSKERVLENVKHWIKRTSVSELASDLQAMVGGGQKPTLGEYLSYNELTLEDIYSTTSTSSWRSWNMLLNEANLSEVTDEDVRDIERWLARVIHLDDQPRLRALGGFFSSDNPPVGNFNDPTQRLAFALLAGDTTDIAELDDTWEKIWSCKPLLIEIRELLDCLDDRVRKTTHEIQGLPSDIPLRAHATYSLPEIMALFDLRSSNGSIRRVREGVKYLRDEQIDLFFVTLDKSDSSFTESTSYDDYPITRSSFHWESQSSCHEDTPTGERYQRIRRETEERAIMFVREHKKDSRGETAPYLCLGPVYYRNHRGGRPMQITWDLEYEMPPNFYQRARIHRG